MRGPEGCLNNVWNLSVGVRKAAVPRWGSLLSCDRLSIGQLFRFHRTAVVSNRRAGWHPARILPHI
jgi:hypothetical protein